jgi:hypothetical protein
MGIGGWQLATGNWQLGEHKLEKLAKLGKYGRKLPPTETQGLEQKPLSALYQKSCPPSGNRVTESSGLTT